MSSQLQVSGEAKIRTIQGPVVANSGVITALDGDASQYVRGDGTLADFPTSTGGGSSVSYYLNSSVSQGTIGGVAYRQLGKTPIAGAGTDIVISANGYVASYITDANDPALLEVPAGNFNCEFYFSVNSNNHNPYVYAEVYKYDGTTFSLIGTSVGVPEYINQGTVINPYYFAIPVTSSALTITDRIAIRIYVNVDGRVVTLHTENGHLCQVVTTFSKGLTSLNNLTRQVQFLGTGTSGTDFNISSSTATHTFNLPIASAANTGKLSSTDWSVFNAKQAALSFTAPLVNTSDTISIPAATSLVDGYLDNLDWTKFNTAYNDSIISAAVTGTTTKTLTLNQQDGGTITASWTDDNTDAVTSVFGRTGAVVATSGDYNTSQVTENTNLYFTDARARAAISLTTTGTSGAATYNSTTGVFNIPNYTPDLSGYVPTSRTITINGTSFDLSANRSYSVGTVTSVGLSSATSGVTIGSSPITTSGTITLSIATASGSQNGLLSSTDWTTFNNKQNALTNPITGTGTRAINYIPVFSVSSSSIENSVLQQVNGNIGLGVTPSAWNTVTAFQVGSTSVGGYSNTGYLNGNAFFQTSWKYINSSFAARYEINSSDAGIHRWYTAPSGTAGNSITFTEAMTLTAAGELLVGTPTRVTGLSGFTQFEVSGSEGGITINSNTTTANKYSRLMFTKSGATGNEGLIRYNVNDYHMAFWTNATEQMRIFSDGNVGINTAATNAGYKLDVNGTFRVTGNLNYNTGSAIYPRTTTVTDWYLCKHNVTLDRIENALGTNNPFTLGNHVGSTYTANIFLYGNGAATFSSSVNIGTAGSEKLNIFGAGSQFINVKNTTTNADMFVGMSSALSAAFIGTGGTDPIVFSTAGSEKVRITSGGNVLIGTTTDSGYKLDVNGTGRFTSSLRTSDIYVQNGTSGGYVSLRNGGAGAAGYMEIYSNNGTTRLGYIGYSISNLLYTVENGARHQFEGGAATFSSSITATSFFESSDSRLKIIVKDYEQPKGIENVAARMYVKNSKQELGYFAQDLQEILPSAVSEGADGFLNLSYSQVHTAKIAYLEDKVAQLEELIKSLKIN
jgi:hypothetical protein